MNLKQNIKRGYNYLVYRLDKSIIQSDHRYKMEELYFKKYKKSHSKINKIVKDYIKSSRQHLSEDTLECLEDDIKYCKKEIDIETLLEIGLIFYYSDKTDLETKLSKFLNE